MIFSLKFPPSPTKVPADRVFHTNSLAQWRSKSGIEKMAASSLRAQSIEAAVPDQAKTELLVRLLIRHQDELFRYIYALLPHQEDARDAPQETCVALYRKHADYNPAKPFLA